MLKYLKALMISVLLVLWPSCLFADFAGVVAYWSLDEGGGDEAEDVSGNGHNGVVKGMEWTAGKMGKALEITGQNNADMVEIPDADDLDGMMAMTLTVWANIEGTGTSAFPRFVSKGHEDSWTFLIDVAAGNRLRFIVNRPAGKIDITQGTTNLADFFGEFHHYAVTWNGSSVVFYIDGAEVSRAAAAAGPGSQTALPVLIGNSPSGRAFQGVLDEVGVFNVALSQGDIKSLMQNGLKGGRAVESEGKLPTVWGKMKASFLQNNKEMIR